MHKYVIAFTTPFENEMHFAFVFNVDPLKALKDWYFNQYETNYIDNDVSDVETFLQYAFDEDLIVGITEVI